MSNIEYNIEEDIAYIEGVEVGEEKGIKKGREEGIEKGREEGIEKGWEKGKIEISIIGIQNMTIAKLETKQIANFLKLDLNFVLNIQKQLLKTDKINALLGKKEAIETVAKKLKVNPILVKVLKDDIDKRAK